MYGSFCKINMKALLISVSLILCSSTSVHATLLVDFTLGTEVDAAGGQAVQFEASNATPRATINALSGLKVFDDAHQTATKPGSGNHHIVFSDIYLPDIFLIQGENARVTSNSGNVGSAGQGTSTKEPFLAKNSATGNMFLTFDFGSYSYGPNQIADDSDDSFSNTHNPVLAAAFTLSSIDTGDSAIVNFVDPNGNTLSTQSSNGNVGNLYFGFYNGVSLISKIEIAIYGTGGYHQYFYGDIAFLPKPPNGTIFRIK